MRGRGINYDTGFFPGGKDSRPGFNADDARREMRIIADDLHCTAVRISGGGPERIAIAARHAGDAGLEVWFAPFPCELAPEKLLTLYLDCAERAEAIRVTGVEVVLVLGCESSLFASGFIPGDDVYQRIETLMNGGPELWSQLGRMTGELNDFLARTVALVRTRFGGRVTYASGTWEQIDWEPFDIVAVDAYRDVNNAAAYRDELREQFRHGKPVAVTEFGCSTYVGAADKGGLGWAIVDDRADPPQLDGDYTRSEQEQVTYLRDLLAVFDDEGVDSAFWFTFAAFDAPHRPDDPRRDLDMAGYGTVKMLAGEHGTAYPDLRWEPKKVFHALAAAYAS